jgi:hypothetical protein
LAFLFFGTTVANLLFVSVVLLAKLFSKKSTIKHEVKQ